tara:strand:- start:2949 stop:3242 length:294 start_codon:yes stop_codon:yes gene_type:complete
MYLLPIIRVNRAIASTLLFPEHPIYAISASEIISVFGPFFNPNIYTNIMTLIISIMYNPNFADFFIKKYKETQTIYYQSEICSSLLFIITYYLYINK